MIDAREIIRSLVAGRELTGSDGRSEGVERVQGGVNRLDAGRRDGHDPRRVPVRLLEIRKKEGAAPPQRAAERSAVLRLGQRILGCRERVAGIQAPIAQKIIEPAVPLIGAGLGGDVDDPAGGAAEFCVPARGDHLEFADHLLAVKRAGKIRSVVVGRKLVEHKQGRGEACLKTRFAIVVESSLQDWRPLLVRPRSGWGRTRRSSLVRW